MNHLNRILIVDDEVEQLRTMKLGLRSRRYVVTTARNSKEALQHLMDDREGYDVVITDYCMPGMSGLQLLKKVKTEHKDMAVIMMTAYGKKEEFADVLEKPDHGFIEKPFSMPELVREIERVQQLQTQKIR
jgi:DNA-binding NtrC family response regulator